MLEKRVIMLVASEGKKHSVVYKPTENKVGNVVSSVYILRDAWAGQEMPKVVILTVQPGAEVETKPLAV